MDRMSAGMMVKQGVMKIHSSWSYEWRLPAFQDEVVQEDAHLQHGHILAQTHP